MQKLLMGLASASMILAATPQLAMAQPKAGLEAKLATPVTEAKKVIIDGRLWRCEADRCLGQEQGDSQPLKRECARAVKVLGPVVSYRNGAREVTGADLDACNGKSSEMSKAN